MSVVRCGLIGVTNPSLFEELVPLSTPPPPRPAPTPPPPRPALELELRPGLVKGFLEPNSNEDACPGVIPQPVDLTELVE